MIDYSAMGTLNDLLGGVTVNIGYDMTIVNPAWTNRIGASEEVAKAFCAPGKMTGYMAVLADEITIGDGVVVKPGEMLDQDRI